MVRLLLIAALLLAMDYQVSGFYLSRRGTKQCWVMVDCHTLVTHAETDREMCSVYVSPTCLKYMGARRRGLNCDPRLMEPLDSMLKHFAERCH